MATGAQGRGGIWRSEGGVKRSPGTGVTLGDLLWGRASESSRDSDERDGDRGSRMRESVKRTHLCPSVVYEGERGDGQSMEL